MPSEMASKMISWNDLDSFQLNLQQSFQGYSRPPAAWQGGFQHVHQRFIAPTQSTLSLDRYLQLLQLLCGGQPSTATDAAANSKTAWIVRQLGELERAAVKMEDLKKMLALNGYAITTKNKQDMLDKMAGLQLASPTFLHATATHAAPAVVPAAAFRNPEKNPALVEAAQQQDLQQAMQRALQWADISPAENTVAAAAISRQGCYSFCPLPDIKLPYPSSTEAGGLEVEEGFQKQHQDAFVPPQQPAASATTFASRPAIPHAHIAESSPQVPPLRSPPGAAADRGAAVVVEEDTEMQDAVQQHKDHQSHKQHRHQHASPSPPEWLIPGYQKLAAICQGIKTLPMRTKTSKESTPLCNLIGRKVALVMMEDFQQGGGDRNGGNGGSGGNDDNIVDTVSRGIHLGQVVEWIGYQHDSEICPEGCSHHHNFCYVRVTPTETTAPAHRRGRRRLDLAVDLREEYRLETLEDLLLVGERELADAWVLVEPKEDE